MAVITISRQFGAGGRTLGERLSKRLGYRYVDEDMIKRVAKKLGASPHQVRAFEKRGGSKLSISLESDESRDYLEQFTSDKYGYMDEKRYVDVVRVVIEELYEGENTVIIGRGGQYILKDREHTWHLLLIGELENRIRFMMDNYKLTKAEAEKTIRRAAEVKARFLSLFSNKGSHEDPSSYDLVLNMNRVSMEKAEELVVKLTSQ